LIGLPTEKNAMNVNIPESFREFVAAQIATGKYADENALICALLQKEQACKERESIDGKLLEALDRSESTAMTSTDWDDIRAEFQRRQTVRNGSRP
jgi:Arc/MetJ-type ribon-helix-helix transcriptional regulator